MNEIPSTEIYKGEYYYQRSCAQQALDFDEFLLQIPEDADDLRAALRKANANAAARDPRFILDPESLKELKEANPDIYQQLLPPYQKFISKKAGIE